MVLDVLSSLRNGDRQPDHVLVVDNGPTANRGDWVGRLPDRCDVVVDIAYLGSGGAFVAGLREAAARGFARVLLLDHDAVVRSDALRELLKAWDERGPGFYSAKQSDQYGGWLRKSSCATLYFVKVASGEGLLTVDLAPWSGLLVPAAAATLAYTGDPYFFGWDDYEFCVLAARAGWRVYGVTSALVGTSKAGAPGSPWKRYYFSRNAILFFVRNLDDRRWAATAWLFRHLLVQLVRSIDSPATALMWARGVCDGMRGVRGMTVPPVRSAGRKRRV
jgi:GT2 family glycosyltransferase